MHIATILVESFLYHFYVFHNIIHMSSKRLEDDMIHVKNNIFLFFAGFGAFYIHCEAQLTPYPELRIKGREDDHKIQLIDQNQKLA